MIADQVPSRLVPEALKNTNLKIVHRLVAEDDRKAVSATMGMTDEQSRYLVSLAPRHAGVFSEGEDAPLLIRIRDTRSQLQPVDVEHLRAASPTPLGPNPSGCCSQSTYAVCDRARGPASDEGLRALVAKIAVTAATVPSALSDLSTELKIRCQELLPTALASDAAATGWRCLVWRNADYLARHAPASENGHMVTCWRTAKTSSTFSLPWAKKMGPEREKPQVA